MASRGSRRWADVNVTSPKAAGAAPADLVPTRGRVGTGQISGRRAGRVGPILGMPPDVRRRCLRAPVLTEDRGHRCAPCELRDSTHCPPGGRGTNKVYLDTKRPDPRAGGRPLRRRLTGEQNGARRVFCDQVTANGGRGGAVSADRAPVFGARPSRRVPSVPRPEYLGGPRDRRTTGGPRGGPRGRTTDRPDRTAR